MSSKSIWITITIQMNCYLARLLSPVSGKQLSWRVMCIQTSRTNSQNSQDSKTTSCPFTKTLATTQGTQRQQKTEEGNKIRMSHLQWEERVHSFSAWPCAVCEASLLAAEVWSGPHGSCNQMRWLTAVEMGHRLLTFVFWDSHGIYKILYTCNLDSQKGLSHQRNIFIASITTDKRREFLNPPQRI